MVPVVALTVLAGVIRLVQLDTKSLRLDDAKRLDAALTTPGRLWILLSHCYTIECADLVAQAAGQRKITRVATSPGVELHLAEATPGKSTLE